MNILQAMLVRRIYEDSSPSTYRLAKDFGVSQASISHIIRGILYNGIPNDPMLPYWLETRQFFDEREQWQRQLSITAEQRRAAEEMNLARRSFREFKNAVRQPTRICGKCRERKPITEFKFVDGRGYRRKLCSACW